MTAWFFLAFLCFWTWAIAAVTWRLLKTGRIEILGDKLAIQRSKHPLLFWLRLSGGLLCLPLGLLMIVQQVAFMFRMGG
jgi:hypothetical protein